jgi:hypothetical protein
MVIFKGLKSNWWTFKMASAPYVHLALGQNFI